MSVGNHIENPFEYVMEKLAMAGADIGLYEISRRREQGRHVTWASGFEVLGSPALGSILRMGLILVAIFGLWLAAAYEIYALTLGGAIVAGLLVLGSIPALIGLVVVMPLLGHATWRLYRKVIADA